ncbi:MAG TPA: DUF2207 domain-containing protein, partial [Candidatus Saccharimonadales bacterium]|nr:DUF2207 domain-containing protein [Candidatus Saccharimonadales bacterium]
MVKRLGVAIFIVIVCVLGVGAKAHAQNVNNFTVQNFIADYYLSKDAAGHSQLKTIEKIIVFFPQTDQNHGIERAIPQSYNHHSTQVKLSMVTDGDEQPLEYTTRQSDGNLVVRIGDPGQYVHGQQTYVITYTQTDVTATFSDHDELYWNTNGTQWDEPFEALTAQVHIPQSLTGAYQSKTACYVGAQNSTNSTCVVATTKDQNGGLVASFQPGRALQPNENLTFVLGFNKSTFAVAHMNIRETISYYLGVVWKVLKYVLPLVVIALGVYIWAAFGRSAKGKGTIVPQYTPPAKPNLLQNAQLLGKAKKSVTAQIISMAVQGNIKVYDTVTKQHFGHDTHEYELEVIKIPQEMAIEERMLLEALFPWPLKVGMRARLSDYKTKLGTTAQSINKAATSSLVTDGYCRNYATLRTRLRIVAVALLAVSIVMQAPSVFLAVGVVLIFLMRLRARTKNGTETLEYLKGLKMYMKMAEADRIRYLQSPTGAEKIEIDTNNPQQLVKLYEKLLPYAILFGIEKEWAAQFADLYKSPPEWYAGDWSTFNAIIFVNALGGFTSNVARAFAPPSNSSSSGFSGGFSGGGGGGGGGG